MNAMNEMNEINRQTQIGTFIRDMRMEQGMTQQQLADRLGITDKAVSKWERNICCPDITLLRPLSDALGVTVTELLEGRRGPEPEPESRAARTPSAEDVENMVVSVVSYSETACRKNGLKWLNWVNWRSLAFVWLTAACIIAIGVCLICDLAVNQSYTWSTLVYPSIGLGWLVCTPLLLARKNPARWALAALSVVILPYLCGLGWMLKNPMIIKISVWVVPISLAWLWLAYAVFVRLNRRKWQAAGIVLLLAAPLASGINFILDRYIGSESYHDIWIALLCAAACFLTDFALRRREQ